MVRVNRLWCTGVIQIQTRILFRKYGVKIIKGNGNGTCPVLVVEGNHHFVVVDEDGVDEGINQHLAVGFLPHVQLAETVQPKGHKLGADLRLCPLPTSNSGFQLAFIGLQLLQSPLRGLGEDAFPDGVLEVLNGCFGLPDALVLSNRKADRFL